MLSVTTSVSRCDCLASTQKKKKTSWKNVWDVHTLLAESMNGVMKRTSLGGDSAWSGDPGAVGVQVRLRGGGSTINNDPSHIKKLQFQFLLTRCTDSNISMAAVFPGVLIIADGLLWLRGVFNQGSVGGKQTIFCLCNSHWSQKHKYKINNGS